MLPSITRRNQFSGLLDEFFGNWMNEFSNDFAPSVPAVNVAEEKDSYRIEVAAPGLDKKDFKIDLHNNLLTISSEKKEEKKEKEDNYVRREFNYSTFKRSFTIPESVDADKIKATHKEGILKVVIPKKEEAIEKGLKQIEIS